MLVNHQPNTNTSNTSNTSNTQAIYLPYQSISIHIKHQLHQPAIPQAMQQAAASYVAGLAAAAAQRAAQSWDPAARPRDNGRSSKQKRKPLRF